eukprot:6189105-Prymnesium_polylepis.1
MVEVHDDVLPSSCLNEHAHPYVMHDILDFGQKTPMLGLGQHRANFLVVLTPWIVVIGQARKRRKMSRVTQALARHRVCSAPSR